MSGRDVDVKALIDELHALEETARLIREGKAKSVYLAMGKLIVEVSVEDALDYIERRIAALRSLLSKTGEDRG